MSGDTSGSQEFVNLLLADGMARRYGLSRVAACQRWARRARANTKDEKIYQTATTIAKCKEPHRIGMMLELLTEKLKEEGIL